MGVGQIPERLGLDRVQKHECEPTYHRFYSLEPIGDEETGAVLVISVCSNCSKVNEYRTNIKKEN